MIFQIQFGIGSERTSYKSQGNSYLHTTISAWRCLPFSNQMKMSSREIFSRPALQIVSNICPMPFQLGTAHLPTPKCIGTERISRSTSIVGQNKTRQAVAGRLVNFSLKHWWPSSANIFSKYSWKETITISWTCQSQKFLLSRSLVHHGIYYLAVHWPICCQWSNLILCCLCRICM